MRIEDLNWQDVDRYLESEDRLMFVLGACEQHGYLSLLTDTKIPLALADAASKRTGVLVAPAINVGSSPYFLKFPGTLSLRISTMLDLVEDLTRSAYGQGFKRLLFLNGHGGNNPVRARLSELVNQLPDIQLAFYSWWQSNSVEMVCRKHELRSYHGGWVEAFAYTRVSELPAGEKLPVQDPGFVSAEKARSLFGDGVFGGRYEVDSVILDEVFTAALEDVLHLLRFENG